MRYYASWIARFISTDPLQFEYPMLTPFQYASNRPISGTDLDGAEYVEKSKLHQYAIDILHEEGKKDIGYDGKQYIDMEGEHLYIDKDGNYSATNENGEEEITEYLFGSKFNKYDYEVRINADKSKFIGWRDRKMMSNGKKEGCGNLTARQILILTHGKYKQTSSKEGKEITVYYAKGNTTNKGKVGNTGNLQSAEIYIKNSIDKGIPMAIIVDEYAKANNKDGGDHFVTGVAYGCKDGKCYISFWDNAVSNKDKGTDSTNKLIYDSKSKRYIAKKAASIIERQRVTGIIDDYTITTVRKTVKK